MWIVDDVNISDMLNSIRNSSVEMANNRKDLPDFRELTISQIFLLCPLLNESSTRSLGSSLHIETIASLPKSPSLHLSVKASQWTMKLLQMITSNPSLTVNDMNKCTAQWIVEACNDDENDENGAYLTMFADILHRTAPCLLRGPILDDLEDTFIHDAASDLLDVIFGEDRQLSHQWANKKLPGTPAEVTMKPDYMVSVRPAQRVVFSLAADINPPTNCSKENVCNDKVKLGHETKLILQTLQTLKVHGPRSFGLLKDDGNEPISADHQDPGPSPPPICS
ncbi:predicted protein [Lichtheimia corymbifera JMRC:FSU:9682]|uniref:Uncharacterized protein n=1 Tax=Lichtheimia corymbifera JMRC:FSU:9682 TaxID=1263082 RepID=A0A068RRI9_9FUNG|nr:predicted protein [Lichtheimia corymbifera JMRC:FSU:9682]